jgi:ABC-2 type transport system permease protein/lipopolysaccharide transport system permease protein
MRTHDAGEVISERPGKLSASKFIGRPTPPPPPPELRFRRRLGVGQATRELWRARELLRTLAERELRARYKQAVLGFGWAVITPVVLMIVLTLVFPRMANIDTHGAPYPLFAYLGLLPWAFFSASVLQGGMSLVNNAVLLNKVYCPREVFPIANVVVAGIDMAISTVILVVLFLLPPGFAPKATSVWVPVLLVIQVTFTLAVTMLTSVILVYFRDLRHALPIVLQLGLFATPVAYGIEVIPESIRTVYCMLNPLAPVIDGYRRTVLWGLPPSWELLGPAAAATAVLLVVAYIVFKRLETGLADVA